MTTLLPELAREMAIFHRKVVAFGQKARERRETVVAARQLTHVAITRGGDPKEVWQTIQDGLNEGVPGERAREIVDVARDVANSWLELAENARELWLEAKLPPEDLDSLEVREREVREILAAVNKACAFFTRPRPPVDLERLREGLAEAEQGKVKTAAEMRELFRVKKA